jgi:hypothetical protein
MLGTVDRLAVGRDEAGATSQGIRAGSLWTMTRRYAVMGA